MAEVLAGGQFIYSNNDAFVEHGGVRGFLATSHRKVRKTDCMFRHGLILLAHLSHVGDDFADEVVSARNGGTKQGSRNCFSAINKARPGAHHDGIGIDGPHLGS